MKRRATTIYDRSVSGRGGAGVEPSDADALSDLPAHLLRTEPVPLPQVDELTLVRHYTALSRETFHITGGFYPLGSCTMKYNPPANDRAAGLGGLTGLHPGTPEAASQGTLALMWHLEQALAGIVGLPRVTLQPSAGAQGEFCGLQIIRAWHWAQGDRQRDTILVPDSAHGTNPASAALAGFKVAVVPSGPDGLVDLDRLKALADDRCAGLMLTNPNTLGLFETDILEICDTIHAAGGLVYMDGANLNALMGIARPGDMGVDVLHMNLHKTFSTPHGGGGPGAGPVAVTDALAPLLPSPTVVRGDDGVFVWAADVPQAVGRLHGFYGNVGVLVRAYAYILMLGGDGLARSSRAAILSANYLKSRVTGSFELAQQRHCMHEFLLTLSAVKTQELRAWDICKRLMDFGVHPPTVGFPINVPESLMIETPESESIEVLDQFAEALWQVSREVRDDPKRVANAPHSTPLRRLDEVRAVRQPDLGWQPRDPAGELADDPAGQDG